MYKESPEGLLVHNVFAFSALTFTFSALTPLVGRQEGHPACKKLNVEVLAWLSVWSEVQMIAYGPADAKCCHPFISCSSKIQSGLCFWCRLTQVSGKRPLNGCSSTHLSCSFSQKAAL